MRRSSGTFAVLLAGILGMILAAAAPAGQGGAPGDGGRWAGPPTPVVAAAYAPLLGKRWS